MSDQDTEDRALKIAIAQAKWSVEYDTQQVEETRHMERSQGILGRILGGGAVAPDVKEEELQNLKQSILHLKSLEQEARARGINPDTISVRSNHDYWGDL